MSRSSFASIFASALAPAIVLLFAACASSRPDSETVENVHVATPRRGASGGISASNDGPPPPRRASIDITTATAAAAGDSVLDGDDPPDTPDDADANRSLLSKEGPAGEEEVDSGSSVRALSPKLNAAASLDRLRGGACVISEDVTKMRALLADPKARTKGPTLERLVREGDRLVTMIRAELDRRDPKSPSAQSCAQASADAVAAARATLGAPSAATGAAYSKGLRKIERNWLERDALPKER